MQGALYWCASSHHLSLSIHPQIPPPHTHIYTSTYNTSHSRECREACADAQICVTSSSLYTHPHPHPHTDTYTYLHTPPHAIHSAGRPVRMCEFVSPPPLSILSLSHTHTQMYTHIYIYHLTQSIVQGGLCTFTVRVTFPSLYTHTHTVTHRCIHMSTYTTWRNRESRESCADARVRVTSTSCSSLNLITCSFVCECACVCVRVCVRVCACSCVHADVFE